MKTKKDKKKEGKLSNNTKWIITAFILTFFLSLVFSFISSGAITNLEVIPGTIVLLAVILLGIVFDILGVAITVAKEGEFNAMASKKVKGAKTALKLIKNASIVSNICADVIGDIAGVLSGAISAIIAIKIASYYSMPFDLQVIISAIVASLTVGGKAIGKEFARKNSTAIISAVTKVIGR